MMATADGNNNYELDELNDAVNEFWLTTDRLVTECRQQLDRIVRHKSRCNIAKSVGTGVGGVGSVAVVVGVGLTPFTAGLSALVSLGGGITAALGAVTTIGTEAGDYFRQRAFHRNLVNVATERNQSAERLAKKLAAFDQFLGRKYGQSLEEKHEVIGDDNQQSMGPNIVKLVQVLANGSMNVYKIGEKSVKLANNVKEFRVMRAAKTVKDDIAIVGKVGQNIGTLASAETKGVSGLISSATKATVPSAGKLALRGASAAVGIVFTVIDVVSLVKDWNRNHPSATAVECLIDDLLEDMDVVKTLNDVIVAWNHSLILSEYYSDEDIIDDQSSISYYTIDDTYECGQHL
ncbi:uncharacterized protein LOC128959466 [Oppia nitens]|uniref:uncharacterized protein LOC128959466 n=1 Tax=Oppia nitens TaxID=1686743 RepID=UPI0023DA97D6|nr:uncharacterized protein LOC128959466 [Oppia nitens]